MKVTPFLNVAVEDKVANISIIGDIGYNFWADTYEDYKKNTSENMASELQSIQSLEVDTINVTLESLGGDVSHALAIYSMLKNSGSTINTFYRGANASASTIIGSAASSVDNIHMDNTGLFLVHKVMSYSEGNANDMQDSINDLNKWQTALEQAYVNLGVTQEVLNDLMERNGGHGEWLTFNEAKEYGFVGQSWETQKVMNYSKSTFENKGILTPNKFNNQKVKIMEDQDKKSLFTEFKNWFKNESEAEAKAIADAKFLEDLKSENEALKTQLEEATKVEEVIEEETIEEVAEEVAVEVSQAELIENAVKAAIKNIVEPTKTKDTKVTNTENLPVWKQHLTNHQNFNK